MNKSIRRCLYVSLVVVASAPAHAADLPKYDIQLHCKSTNAFFAGTLQDSMLESCLQAEEKYRKYAAFRLDRFDSSTIEKCDTTARVVTGGSYLLFAGCLSNDVVSRFFEGTIDFVPVAKPR